MNICLVHGYFLKGTGSNNYLKYLAKTFCALGHNLTIVCQEYQPEEFDFITEYFEFNHDNNKYNLLHTKKSPYPGSCRLFRPHLNGQILVYVPQTIDQYQSTIAFQNTAPTEIKQYIQQNTLALRKVLQDFPPDFIQANHLIMQPCIVARARPDHSLPFVITLHGSAFNFSVKANPNLIPYAKEGLKRARTVISLSPHGAKELSKFLAAVSPDLIPNFTIIPPGIDPQLFRPAINPSKTLGNLQKSLADLIKKYPLGQTKKNKTSLLHQSDLSLPLIKKTCFSKKLSYEPGHPDQDSLATLDKINWSQDQIILYVGTLLPTKGVHALLTAFPEVLNKHPRTQLLFVGAGDLKEALLTMVGALNRGDQRGFFNVLTAIHQISNRPQIKTPLLCQQFFQSLSAQEVAAYFNRAKKLSLKKKVHFLGPLLHEELKNLYPLASLLSAPSIFPEAFALVPLEALSSGVFPIIPAHSGLTMIAKTLQNLPLNLKKMPLDKNFIPRLAENLNSALANPLLPLAKFKKTLHQFAADNFSWKKVALDYLKIF